MPGGRSGRSRKDPDNRIRRSEALDARGDQAGRSKAKPKLSAYGTRPNPSPGHHADVGALGDEAERPKFEGYGKRFAAITPEAKRSWNEHSFFKRRTVKKGSRVLGHRSDSTERNGAGIALRRRRAGQKNGESPQDRSAGKQHPTTERTGVKQNHV